MTILYINTGSSANAGDGDTLRTAFNKVNANFTYLSTASFSGGGGAGAPGPSGPRGPQGVAGNTGPQGPQGPGADQRLNTTSSVTFTNITIVNTATIPSLRATAATVTTLNANTVTSADGFFYNLSADGQTNLANLNVGTNAVVSGVLETPSALITKLTATNATIANLTAPAARVTVATATNLFATIGTVNTLTVVNQAYVSNVNVTSTATFSGNAVFANTASFRNILPSADATYNLGSPTQRWKNLYVSTSTIYLAGDVVTVAAGKLTINGVPVLGTATTTVLGGVKIGHNLAATAGGTLTSYQSVVDIAPPYDAQESDQWFDAVGGKQYVFYQGYWVETNLTGVGDPGPRGPSGPVGPKGNTGDQGISVTLVGSTATSAGLPLTGNAGDGWIVNDTGDLWFWSTANSQWEDIGQIVGPQGDPGDPGPEGPSGPSGPSGPIGYQGASGPSGADSTVAGPSGPSGAQGDPGANADFNYLDAFQLSSTYAKNDIVTYDGASYVAKGTVLPNVGSPDTNSTDWQLVTARGPSGPQGIQGPQGAQGVSGPSGAQGNAGPSGAQGNDGPSGPSGPQGEQGLPGGNANTADFLFTHSEMIAATNADITVVTNANTWTFAADGFLTFPNGDLTIGYNGASNVIEAASDTLFTVLGSGPGGAVGFQWISDTTTSTTNAAAIILNSPFASNSGTVQIATGAVTGPVTEHTWEFGPDGILTLPGGNTRIGNAFGTDAIVGNTGTSVGVLVQGQGAAGGIQWVDNPENIGTTSTQVAAVVVNSQLALTTGTVQVVTGVTTGTGIGSNTWEFGADGTLTAPGHLMPNADLAYDLGSTTTQWRSIYVGTGTIFIGGVALGVDQNNYVTVDGNPIITVNTAGNFTVQGDTNIVLGSVVISDTAPAATTPGSQWYNSLDGRTYIAYNGTWIDASPTIVPAPETYLGEIAIDGDTLNINGSTLTINTSGTLLVNGSEVTGSGGGGDRLTAGSYSVILGTDGMVTFPDFDGTKTLWGAVDEDFSIRTTRTDPGSDADIDIYAADDLRLYAEGDELQLHANSNVLIYTDTTNTNRQWTFGDNGLLTLPDGGIISEGAGPFTGAIKLTPAGGANAYQALMIYPTAGVDGNHIHLTAGYGGETDLYLGNDDQYVKIDNSGTVVIGTLGANTSTWTFGTDAVLTLPNGMTIDSYGALGVNAFVSIGGDNTRITIDDNGAPPGLYITTDAAGANYGWQFGPDGVLTLSTASTILGTGLDPNVYIETATTATTSTWTFGTDGVLTLPAATPIIKGSGTGTDVTIIAQNTATTSTWVFAADGNLDLPAGGDITQNGNSVLYPKIDTVTTTSMTFITTGQTIIFADPTTANGNVDLYLPDNPPEGKTYTVKNISSGTTLVGTSGPTIYLETEFGLYSSGTYATINVTNAAITWVFSNNGYRIINMFGLA